MCAISAADKKDDEPEGGGVEGAPEDFAGRENGGAENDKRRSGTDMEELGEENALGIGVGPGDEHPNSGHGGGEDEEKGEPVASVRRGGAEKIDGGKMPEAPEKTEDDGGRERVAPLDQFGEDEPHPADFFEKAGWNAEEDSEPKMIRCVGR